MILAGSVFAQAQSVTCTSVVRGNSMTCTASGGAHYRNWLFFGSDGTGVSRGAAIDSPSWTGQVVQNGKVSVDVYSSQGASHTVYSPVVVIARPLNKFSIVAVTPDNQAPGYVCVNSAGQTVTLNLPSPPGASLTGDSVLGKFCQIPGFTYSIEQVADTGPNAGYAYVLSVTSQTQFHWVYSNDLQQTSSAFYQAQCGNYNAQSNPNGYMSGLQLVANTINHESGNVTGHYGNWLKALQDPTQNPGSVLEGVATVTSSSADFQSYASEQTAASIAALTTSTTNEPCGPNKGVNYDASCTFIGNVNFMDSTGHYTSCN
jgi:hypothetical protein